MRSAFRFSVVAQVALLTALSAGCAIRPTADLNTFAAKSGHASFEVIKRGVDVPDTLVLPVVYDRQTEGPACGSHALASIIKYWRKDATEDGSAIFRNEPPQSPSGYSMAELLTLAGKHGLFASAVRLDTKALIAELDKGRPVLVPIRLPAIYVQQRTIPVGDVPLIGTARNFLMSRSGKVSELTGVSMVNHYLVVIGYGKDKLVVLDPVMGYRTISTAKLERYRKAFGNAAIVSAAATTAPPAPAPAPEKQP